MKALIVYSSQSGNTGKLAQAIQDSLTIETRILPVEQLPVPEQDEIVFVGFWLQGGKPDPKSAEYLTRVGGAQLFLFATHGAAAESRHAQDAMDHAKSLAPAADILGMFNCQGQVDPKVLDKARQKSPRPVWVDDAAAAAGHPDEMDLGRLRAAVRALRIV
jgi:flavodoxin